ncbi:MAG: glycoside hydrolase N-terminal domain-containing protein [Bacteroidia bacterium]|nr:glycoside hydrolase N-terminal domain-containing protein [Bacteroidia bacterium]
MNKIIVVISIFLLFSCNQVKGKAGGSTKSGNLNSSLISRIKGEDSLALNSGNIIWSGKPASEWAEGYPVGNGRLGGMVLGAVQHERISVNHDLLWRQFWSYQEHKTASDIKKIRELNLKGEWDKAEDLMEQKIPASGNAIYINPYVPAGDLYISFQHANKPITDYKRVLYMDKGLVEVKYRVDNVMFTREIFSSWKQGVMATHLTADRAGMLTGEVSLSRLLDPECEVTGYATQDKVILKGKFEEGREFAIAVKVIQRGGRLTIGRKELIQNKADMPKKDFGLKYVFSKNEMFRKEDGASTFFDTADEVLILLAITVDDEFEKGADLVKKTIEKLDRVTESYDTLKEAHIQDFQKIYNRVSLSLGPDKPIISTDSLLKKSVDENTASPALLEKMFNMSRYLAISSGRPQPEGQPAKAPINLQGIWNQDRRPAWDCDYHIDLNVEMCYWPLDMLNLGDLMIPLMDWVETLKEGGRKAAKDLYGAKGVAYGGVLDNKNIGNFDNICFPWTGGAAWVAQILWQHWEYSNDRSYLQNHLFPFLVEIGNFYEDFLVEDRNGRLVPSLSASPEMPIAGRKRQGFSSSASSMDLELIHDVFGHLIEAGNLLKTDPSKIKKWQSIVDRVPLPRINADGSMSEWLEDHTMADPGHRHRSLLVGLCPGDRISFENTKEYADAAYKAILKRHETGRKMTQSLTFVWDAQLLARLYKAEEAYDELVRLLPVHTIDNLLITCNDWSGARGGLAWFKGVKLVQVEASLALGSAITEMIFQDRQGLLRFLPALPANLSKGKVTGLKARGGFEVGLEWNKGKVYSANIISFAGKTCHFKDKGFDKIKITCSGKEVKYTSNKDKGIISFDTGKGQEYQLTF